MKKTRILFELQQELRDIFDKKILRMSPRLGFNPFLRAVLFFLSEIQFPALSVILDQGLKLERDFEEGLFKPSVHMVYGDGASETEKILLHKLSEYVDVPYDPRSEPDYADYEPDSEQLAEAQAWWLEERERLKEELREEIQEELRKPQGEDDEDAVDVDDR